MPTLSLTPRRAAATVAALAGLGLAAAPAADARGIDPAVYDTGIPAGQVEHGVIDLSITGTSSNQHTRTEYWATADRWRSRTLDPDSGKVLREAFSTKTEFVYVNHAGNEPRVLRGKGPDVPPFAGWTAAYNAKLVGRGVLQPIGQRTVAGIAGIVYTVPGDRKTSDPKAGDDKWVTDNTQAGTEIVLEPETHKPLARISTADNGRFGQFRQAEELVSREVELRTAETIAPLSAATFRRTVRSWNALVKASKAKKARAKKAKARKRGAARR
ncbi:hypothetical protein [Conexibacter sp. SYSU D00693]|uniref:hypothetical protein n=1 Tax=Conexibacter sp. SYSU D00693 TaxID=2812560 RepID=UPI00196A6A2E|nr:hypothetical protein [Conexibacter sp. SYSU D00693]